MSEPIPLVQFRDHAVDICATGALCAVCRLNTPAAEAWRKAQTGQARPACPLGKLGGWDDPAGVAWRQGQAGQPTGTPSVLVAVPARKAVRVAQGEVERRVALTCVKRTAEGRCTVCPTCKGQPKCADVAAWKGCPEGLWEASG